MSHLHDVGDPGDRARRGHAVLDLASRDLKAIKIARLIGAHIGQPPRRMLEIGTGSGGIAHYFGTSGAMGWDVEAIDVEDVRLATDGYCFTLVDGVALPFVDASFDVVVSNHVIEHVGDRGQQAMHLAELARVLRPDGIGYLAVPSRWMLVEPHYKLPFLSWLPRALADAYVRLAGKGSHYDCRPLTLPQFEDMLFQAGFDFEQQHANALRLTYELEHPDAPAYRLLLRHMPDGVFASLRYWFPTLIFVARSRQPEDEARTVPTR